MEEAKEFKFKVIDDDKKEIEIIYKNKSLKLRLKIKRSFTVLKKLLESYPDFMNIHSLDDILNDPNRAHSDLRIGDGFANFLIEKKDKDRVMQIKLDCEKLFKIYDKKVNSNDFIELASSLRKNLSKKEQDEVYKKFNGICNITRIRVYDKAKGNIFFKHSLLAAYDHRRPISKGGTNELSNWQLISKLANDEKNKICNICNGKKCEECALAYPEKYDIIQPTKQNIKKDLKAR